MGNDMIPSNQAASDQLPSEDWFHLRNPVVMEALQPHWAKGSREVVSCGSGWAHIILDLHNELVGEFPNYELAQIKEKFGILTVYLRPEARGDHAASLESRRRSDVIIDRASERSAETCEICGQLGTLTSASGWVGTRCDMHRRS